MITKTGRLILEPNERNPDWEPKPRIEVVTVATINETLGTRYLAKDPKQVEEDLQISIITEIPYGAGKMPLFDAEEFNRVVQLRNAKPRGSQMGTDLSAVALITQMQAELNRLRNEVDRLKGDK